MLKSIHASPRARLLLAKRSTNSTLLVPVSALFPRSRHQSQSRAFRLGPWTSHTDPDLQKEARRRHRGLRYRYMESLGRKHQWEKAQQSESPIAALKAAMAQSMEYAQTSAKAQYAGVDNVKSWSDDLAGVRPGRNIEDAERDAINHLFRGKTPEEGDLWKSSINNIRNYLQSRRAPQTVTPEEVLKATTLGEQREGAIDPITNRRVSTSHHGASSSSKINASKAGSEYKDLGKYSTPTVDDPNAPRTLTPEEKSKFYDDLHKYEPVEWREPDGLPMTTSEEDSKNYKDLDKYSSTDIDDPNAPRKLTPEEKSKLYDDLDKYKPVSWNEPDGLPEQTPEEKSKNYDDLDKYGPVKWNEPDGLQKQTPEELSKNYSDLDKYASPVSWNEPDGLRTLTPEENSKAYDDLDSYATPFVAHDSVLEAHEAKQMDPSPRGNPLPPKMDSVVEDPAKEYDDLDKYGPVRWNEPDGLRKLTPEELSKQYGDLHLYSQYDNAGTATPRVHPEEASKQYQDLHAYAAFPNSGPTVERVHPEVASKKYSDLPRYPRRGYEEPDTTKHVHPEELTKSYQDLNEYKPRTFDSPDKSYPKHPEEATKAYTDLHRYNAVRYNEPDGKAPETLDAVAESLGSYDKKFQYKVKNASSSAKLHPEQQEPSNLVEPSLDFAESRTAQDIRADVLRRVRDNCRNAELGEAKSKHESFGDTTSDNTTQQRQYQQHPNTGRTLTGTYSRDFPEDFTRSWSISKSASKSTLLPKDEATKWQGTTSEEIQQHSEKDDVELSSMDESFPSEETRLESAIHRLHSRKHEAKLFMDDFERNQAMADPYSKAPQGLETSYAEESGNIPTWPTLVKHYRTRQSRSADSEVQQSSNLTSQGQLIVYKILAFDPARQVVNVAETTSGVHDSTSPPTPAEVLVRLSNPSKFFPHFRPLEAQGYEIVSGGGDVLVFRKVREASKSASAIEDTYVSTAPINPVDMMGKPVTGNFASPTGFVNHDVFSSETGDKPAPPFRSNTNVRKQEPVFSGQQTETQKKKKRHIGRKMVVGTATITGAAYAAGVLGEYFASGGVDGRGPRGL